MLLFLLNFTLFALCSLSILISRYIFILSSHLFMLLIDSLKVPGEAAKTALDQVRGLIKSCFIYLLEFVYEALSIFVSALFDHIKEEILRTIGTWSAIGEVFEQTKDFLDRLLKDAPDVMEGLSHIIRD